MNKEEQDSDTDSSFTDSSFSDDEEVGAEGEIADYIYAHPCITRELQTHW